VALNSWSTHPVFRLLIGFLGRCEVSAARKTKGITSGIISQTSRQDRRSRMNISKTRAIGKMTRQEAIARIARRRTEQLNGIRAEAYLLPAWKGDTERLHPASSQRRPEYEFGVGTTGGGVIAMTNWWNTGRRRHQAPCGGNAVTPIRLIFNMLAVIGLPADRVE
jgi:hypothetical protein